MSYPAESDGAFNEVFQQFPLSRFPATPLGYVPILDSNMPISQAAHILSDHNILSAPIRDVTQPDTASWLDKYVGVVDFIGIVEWMMSKSWGHAPQTYTELLNLKESFKTAPISELLANKQRSRFVPVDPNESTLLDVMFILGKYGEHRVWLVNSPGGDIINVVTQSDVIKLINANMHVFRSELTNKSIHELSLGAWHKHVHSVTLQDSYWDAFRKIHDKNVSAVAVVDADGKLVGNISSHDMKAMILDPVQFRSLSHPIGDASFKAVHVHRLSIVTPADTLETVITKLAAEHVHRLYVVDPAHRPVGVVSMRDVIARFVKEPKESTLFEYFADKV